MVTLRVKSVTVSWLVPNYTAWWQWHKDLNNLARGTTQPHPNWEWYSDPVIASTVPNWMCHVATQVPVVKIKLRTNNENGSDGVGCIFDRAYSWAAGRVQEMTVAEDQSLTFLALDLLTCPMFAAHSLPSTDLCVLLSAGCVKQLTCG